MSIIELLRLGSVSLPLCVPRANLASKETAVASYETISRKFFSERSVMLVR